jgi:hypothetical protein
MLPTSFKIHSHIIQIKVLDNIKNGEDYGCFVDAEQTIYVAKNVRIEDDWYELKEDQIKATFFHELIHCFQFYTGHEYDEVIAESFGQCLYEYESNKDNSINN